ncbi:MAG TPA: alpha/beta hydrolase [Acidobacteria bacterium]|nr:alpha/beta hydrolase [Acidobacteriota bacterium]
MVRNTCLFRSARRSVLLCLAALALASSASAASLRRIALEPCHLKDFEEEVRCGVLEVPEDRQTRTGRTIELHVAVLPAVRPESAPDPLFILAGGPGQGARNYGRFVQAAFKDVRRTRDVVLVDVRGTGASNPLDCAPRDPLALLGGGALDLAPCLASLPGDPRFYTTEPIADDLDDVRAALGYRQINLWGGSYGTRTALVYARRHAANVRTLVLDGAVPFEITLPLYNAQGAQRALDRLVADCATDPVCHRAFPRLAEEIQAVLARLGRTPARVSLRHPRTGRPMELTLSRSAFASGLRGVLYVPEHASLVPYMVHAAAQGDFAPFAALSLETAAWSTETMSLGMTLSVLCAEDVPRISDAAAARAVGGTFLGGSEIDTWRQMCSRWPRGPLPAEVDRVRPLPLPALILSGDLDPVTPPRWGEVMQRHFPGARHVVVPGTGHNTSTAGCVPDLIARFIADGNAAGLDASCVAKIRRIPFVIDPSGTAP